MNVSDILQLCVSDVIPLNKSIDGDVLVRIDTMDWYTAKLGEVKTRTAVRLNEVMADKGER